MCAESLAAFFLLPATRVPSIRRSRPRRARSRDVPASDGSSPAGEGACRHGCSDSARRSVARSTARSSSSSTIPCGTRALQHPWQARRPTAPSARSSAEAVVRAQVWLSAPRSRHAVVRRASAEHCSGGTRGAGRFHARRASCVAGPRRCAVAFPTLEANREVSWRRSLPEHLQYIALLVRMSIIASRRPSAPTDLETGAWPHRERPYCHGCAARAAMGER